MLCFSRLVYFMSSQAALVAPPLPDSVAVYVQRVPVHNQFLNLLCLLLRSQILLSACPSLKCVNANVAVLA